MVHIFFRLRALDAYLTHMADIKYTDLVTDSIMFLCDSFVLNGHVIAREGRHQRTQLDMTVVQARGLDLFFHVLNILDKDITLLCGAQSRSRRRNFSQS